MTPPEPQLLASGRHLRLVERNGWEFVDRPGVTGVIGIVAVTDDRKLILVQQYRPPVGCDVIELPAGLAGDVAGSERESLADAAGRELLEETGYAAREMIYLTHGPPSAGLSSEVMTLLLATGLTRASAGGGEGSERITVHEVPLDAARDWLAQRLADGVLIDAKVYAALFFATAGCCD